MNMRQYPTLHLDI